MQDNRFYKKGNDSLLTSPKIGLLASRILRPHLTQTVIETIENLFQDEEIFVSGWHAPIEQEIHSVLIKRNSPHIHVAAKSLDQVTCELGEDKVLFLTHCSDKVQRITRQNALQRNRFVCELADQLLIPWLDPQGKTHNIVKNFCAVKPVFIIDPQYNYTLIESGAKSIRELI